MQQEVSKSTNYAEIDTASVGLISNAHPEDDTRFVSKPTPSTTRMKIFWDRVDDQWHSEVCSVSLGLACFVAMVSVLIAYNGRPAPKISFGITLNAIASALATVSKSALLYAISKCIGQFKWTWLNSNLSRDLSDLETFDEASRGPLGSIKILCGRLKFSLASFGSFLTCLLLVYDPTVQQLIVYVPTVTYGASELVTVPQARYFNAPYSSFTSLQALNFAIWDNHVQLEPNCPSGNCTFDRFRSIEWCGQFHDDDTWFFVDDCNIVFNREDFASALRNVDDFGGNFDFGKLTVHNSADYAYRVTCRLNSTQGHLQEVNLLLSNSTHFSSTSDSYYSLNMPIYQVSEVYNLAMDSFEVGIDEISTQPMGTWVFTNFKLENFSLAVDSARVCSLEICLKEYEVSVAGGRADVKILSNQTGEWVSLAFNGSIDGVEIQEDMVCWGVSDVPSSLADYTALDAAASVLFATNDSNFAFCTSSTDFADLIGIWSWTTLISGSITGNYSFVPPALQIWVPDQPEDDGSNDDVRLLIYNSTPGCSGCEIHWSNGSYDFPKEYDEKGPAGGIPMFESLNPNIPAILTLGADRVIDNIAASLSKLGWDHNSVNITGKNGVIQAVVHVRWVWLLPSAFSLLGAIWLLIFTIIFTNRSKTPIWKTSVNALLYHELSHDSEELPALRTISDMNAHATKTKVKFATYKDSERLVLRTSTKDLSSE